LLKLVAGAITPTVGSGSIFGRDMLRDRLDLRAEIGLMAAETYLYEDLTALENLRFIATMAGRRTREPDLRSALDEVGLIHQAGHRVRTFSSGMKRRLVLARLLVLRPRLLLLDEPYNSLDAAATGLVDDLVRRTLEAEGAAVLATHDAARGLALADRVAVLERGALSYAGSALDYGARDAHHVG
ncbi:MAG: ATP-binding cassette domain-containing protein, partial [Chloroflexi bacterium]|nr:ATP-binding cassette domain-containing protein [Chloroflexota bacterium]